MIKKIESLLLQVPALQFDNPKQPPTKKIKLEKSDDGSESKTDKCDAHVWITYVNNTLSFANNTLSFADKRVITEGEILTDKHINFCQAVLNFPMVEALGCTLYQANPLY